MYRGHSIHVIVACFDIKLVSSIVRFFVYVPLKKYMRSQNVSKVLKKSLPAG